MVRIDSAVETELRYAFGHLIDEDPEGAWQRLRTLDEGQVALAVSYSWYVISYVIEDVFKERTDEGASLIADKIVADISPWYDVGSPDDVYQVLRACVTGAIAEELPPGTDENSIGPLSVILGSHLLAHCYPKGKEWFEYLDLIWSFAEQQSAP